MKNLLLILICFTITNAAAQFPKAQVDSILNSKINDTSPGLMLGIVKDGIIIYENYKGLANIEHQVKIGASTRSNIASTAKQFTALMVLQLSMQGQLSLEDDIRTYLPNLYKDVEGAIKIRQVINHTSGIRDYVELMGLEGEVWWKRVGLDNEDVMALLERQKDLGFVPGSQYSYSNSGYIVLAKIIEAVSGQQFTDYSDGFFQELGMNHTSFIKRYMGVIPNKAAPYADWGYGELFHSISVTKTAGEGFLYTTLRDQLVFEMAVQNAQQNQNNLLIQSQLPIPNSEIQSYGFGLKLSNRLGRQAVHHDGVTNAYHAQSLRFPEENLAIFIMSNNGNLRSDSMADEIASLLLPKMDEELSYANEYDEKPANDMPIEIAGQYYSKSGYLTRIVEDGGKTYFRQGKYLKLELVKESINSYYFANNDKEKVRFFKDRMIIFYPSGEAWNYERIAIDDASYSDLKAFEGTYNNTELDLNFTLQLSEENALEFVFSNEDSKREVLVFNRNDLLAGDNYALKVIRDKFERVIEIKLSYDRAKNISFKKTTNIKLQPKIATEYGTIQVSTIGSKDGDSSDILLTTNDFKGNEIWSKRLGGGSYDKASSILATEDGYLIIGSTSSYGKGNYDIFVIKTDKEGKQLWQKTYGGFYNEYGFSGERTEAGYLIKGSKQQCENNSDINRTCSSKDWFVEIDRLGNEVSNTLLEELLKT
jgi:CubicO group peptidase (beta-lactamase class C family)